MTDTDIFIVGGGINGVGIAADAAGRGLSVTLTDQHDLGGATSSASSKLIHGGLRYLENYDFHLVRDALKERKILLKIASHLVKPLKFILPHETHLRPAWFIRLGLFFYDHLIFNSPLPKTQTLSFKHQADNYSLRPHFDKGFAYYDCATDDSRLVIENALAATENGANIVLHTELVSAKFHDHYWHITTRCLLTQQLSNYRAKLLINATGPWLTQTNKKISPAKPDLAVSLIKGSHILVPKLYPEHHAFILQNNDKRVVFAIPYCNDYTLIGTTDVAYSETDLANIQISTEETQYLCDTMNNYFSHKIMPTDVLWAYAGVRCLAAEPTHKLSKISRDFKVDFDIQDQLVTVVSGKLTTYRILAESTVNKIIKHFPGSKPAWTEKQILPGSRFVNQSLTEFATAALKQFPWLPKTLLARYIHHYGQRIFQLLTNMNTLADLGTLFGADLYEQEVSFLVRHEWARSAEDIVWRRTKTGLKLTNIEISNLQNWLDTYFKHN